MTDIDTKPLRELLALIKTTTGDYEFKALEEHEAYEFAAAVPALLDAADELDRLKAENERLRKAIRDFLSGPHTDQSNRTAQRRADLWRALRAALEGEP